MGTKAVIEPQLIISSLLVYGLVRKDQLVFILFSVFVLFFTVSFDDDAPLCFSVTEMGGGGVGGRK